MSFGPVSVSVVGLVVVMLCLAAWSNCPIPFPSQITYQNYSYPSEQCGIYVASMQLGDLVRLIL